MKIDIKKILNQVEIDEFGRANGVLAVNKPKDMTSHDVVNIVRKKFSTKRVGHAGALDPFATGVLIILVGKFTKLTEKIILEDKEYKVKVLLGVSTDTQDPEGKVLLTEKTEFAEKKIKDAVSSFEGGYDQYVPVFSSVKVGGKKLRELARKSENIEIADDKDKRIAKFTMNGNFLEIEIPAKRVEIYSVKDLKVGDIASEKTGVEIPKDKYQTVEFVAQVSKGTYIRQLAEDIGYKLGVPAMLIALERTEVGDINVEDAVPVDDLKIEKS